MKTALNKQQKAQLLKDLVSGKKSLNDLESITDKYIVVSDAGRYKVMHWITKEVTIMKEAQYVAFHAKVTRRKTKDVVLTCIY